MTATRALVLARGLGTRMRAADPRAHLTAEQQHAADAGSKAMMPIAGRPFLDYLLGAIADAGIRHVGLVVAPAHDLLAHHYRTVTTPERIDIAFLVQAEALGTADAVLAGEHWTEGQPFLVMNADNLYPAPVLRALATLDEPGLPGFDPAELVESGNIPAERVDSFALVETDDRGYLTRIVEKPPAGTFGRAGARALVSMNCWRFDQRIFQACREVPRSPRGEFELPVAVGHAVQAGAAFRVVPSRGPVLDLSYRTDAAALSTRLGQVSVRL